MVNKRWASSDRALGISQSPAVPSVRNLSARRFDRRCCRTRSSTISRAPPPFLPIFWRMSRSKFRQSWCVPRPRRPRLSVALPVNALPSLAHPCSLRLCHPPALQPKMLPSPSTVLWQQRANCFEFCVLLCSLLEGAGYDVYCVNGFATRYARPLKRRLQGDGAGTAASRVSPPFVDLFFSFPAPSPSTLLLALSLPPPPPSTPHPPPQRGVP